MQDMEKKWFKLFIFSMSAFMIVLVIVARWNVTLVEEVKKSGTERESLKKHIEKIELLGKVEINYIKDTLRQKAIALGFWELTAEYSDKYTSKEKQDCIQLIVITDEQYGHKGFDAPLILAWLEKESKGNPEAVSYAGAKGLTQWTDYKAWKILVSMGYPGYEKELILNPAVNLAGGLFYLHGLMNFWEWKGIKDQDIILAYTLQSYKWGSEYTEKLYNLGEKANNPDNQHVSWILSRREYWKEKLKYWIDDAQKLADKWEGKKDVLIDY